MRKIGTRPPLAKRPLLVSLSALSVLIGAGMTGAWAEDAPRNWMTQLLTAASRAGRAPQQQPSKQPGGGPPSGEQAVRIELRGDWFYVDGEPFLIKGVGYSPNRPGQVPWKGPVSLAVMERDFQRIAEAGFNTIRTWSPLSPEALSLADRYGLLVLQGIWVERGGNYGSNAFREAMTQIVSKEVERVKGHRNILAFLVGNELEPEAVYEVGVPEVISLLQRAVQTVKAADPGRAVSYANWPSLAFLDPSALDLVCFNLYPYEPASVAHAFGLRSYVEHLKRTLASRKPLVVTEVGLSESPVVGSKPGYGGLSPQDRQVKLLKVWDDLFQAGAQGGVVFEWNDEWWKHMESANDAEQHDDSDPEEWFGLVEFTASDQVDGRTRPVYDAIKAYNQAIVLSPVSGEWYQERLPVTVYATEAVAQIRVRLDKGKWSSATKLNRHWWKLQLPLEDKQQVGGHELLVEAYDGNHRLLVSRKRAVLIGPAQTSATLFLATDRTSYDVDGTLEPLRYSISVKDSLGRPMANQPVYWSIAEPLAHSDLTQMKTTDGAGRIEGTYLVHEPGIVALSAATARLAGDPERRVGEELFLMVRHQPSLKHHRSPWEEGLPPEVIEALRHDKPVFQLADSGKERIVDYGKYGEFLDIGTPRYRYNVKDWEGLSAAVGEGVYPNEAGLLRDPAYQAAKKANKLRGSHWDFVFMSDPQLSFFRWAEAEEEPGVKQFYTALTLERAGLWQQAVKAYYAVLVHFPMSVGWTAFNPPTPWYVGKVARDKIEAILRLHPELGIRLEGAKVMVEHGFDNDVDNDAISANPGILMTVAPDAVNPPTVDVSALPKRREIGKGRVRLVQYQNGHWQLNVDGRAWTIRGLTYKPTAVGETPDEGTLRDWMTADRNGNGTIDVLETFVDANRNNRQDADEPTVGDFSLIKAMGVNTLRFYHTDHHPKTAKPLLRKLHEQYGFGVMMGDFVGMYTIGSGAKWEDGTDYLDPVQRKRMFDNVKRMVREYKDEPYLLLWVLGNENNYGGVHGIVGGAGNAGRYPKEYYSFVNELATWIHREDPNHPVAIGNGDWVFLDYIAQYAPAIDIFGANAYPGWQGFGRERFEEAAQRLDKPVLITEFGCPAYQQGQSRETAERDQALYHLGNWVDLADNMAGRGVGNAIGGAVFEWADEWWKAGQPPRFSPTVQETQPNWAGPYPGGWNFEEWLGLVSQGDGSASPFLRQPRVSYRLYQQLWKRSDPASAGP